MAAPAPCSKYRAAMSMSLSPRPDRFTRISPSGPEFGADFDSGRGPDPDNRRAQLIQLTPAGRAAAGRIREVGRSGMQAALAHWSPHELHQFATLFHRMVDDFPAYEG
jgi:hypothetical protein